jgi:hypothetical protein
VRIAQPIKSALLHVLLSLLIAPLPHIALQLLLKVAAKSVRVNSLVIVPKCADEKMPILQIHFLPLTQHGSRHPV